MRETYIAAGRDMTIPVTKAKAPKAMAPTRATASHSVSHTDAARARGSWQSLGLGATVLVFDALATGAMAVLMWIGAGASVFQGQPVLIAIAFAAGSIVFALARVTLDRARSARVASITHGLLVAAALSAGYYFYVSLGENYFTAWAIVLGASCVLAGELLDVVIAVVRGRRATVFGHLVAVPFCVGAIVLLSDVWAAPGFLADLTVFAVLIAGAARLVAVGIDLYRRSRLPVQTVPTIQSVQPAQSSPTIQPVQAAQESQSVSLGQAIQPGQPRHHTDVPTA